MTQISQFVRRALQTGAGKIATVCSDRQRTWQEFDDRIRRLAGAMHALGINPGDRVGILSLNSDRYLESLFGLSLGGFVFVPINTRLAPPEIVFWLVDSGCSALFVDDAFVPVLAKVLPDTPELKRVVYIGESSCPPELTDYEALLRALHAGHLRGAALDVYPEEPLPRTSPLLTAPGLTLTPHLAGATEEVSGRMYDIALQALNDLYHRTDWTDVAVRNRQVQRAWPHTLANGKPSTQQAGEQ